MAFTVGELAKLTGITVRTLHHYDQIGLVQPSDRSDAGYRLYGQADVLRLQQVLLYRELGLPLDQIAGVLEARTPPERRSALAKHRETLVAKRTHLDAMLAALDTALAIEEGKQMKPEDVKTMFDGFDPEKYADEARERWGETDAYKESARRTKNYGKAEWDAIKNEADSIYRRFAELMTEGAAPSDARVRGVVEAHRAHIDRWFYPCSVEFQRGLAAMYIADPRFTENIDKYGAGLSQFIHAAVTGTSG
jgi:MerR family transcriptional regulator, thiopeptide resistance regulator